MVILTIDIYDLSLKQLNILVCIRKLHTMKAVRISGGKEQNCIRCMYCIGNAANKDGAEIYKIVFLYIYVCMYMYVPCCSTYLNFFKRFRCN